MSPGQGLSHILTAVRSTPEPPLAGWEGVAGGAQSGLTILVVGKRPLPDPTTEDMQERAVLAPRPTDSPTLSI